MMRVVASDPVTRTIRGSALPPGEGQGAPSPGADEDSLPAGIRNLILGWGGKAAGTVPSGAHPAVVPDPEPRDDG
jgi:hypothetical protein